MSVYQILRDKNGRFFCQEQWDVALRAQFEELGLRLAHYSPWAPAEPRCLIKNSSATTYLANTPKSIQKWIEDNPMPEIRKDELIIILAKRVEALEAALAEKGGSND